LNPAGGLNDRGQAGRRNAPGRYREIANLGDARMLSKLGEAGRHIPSGGTRESGAPTARDRFPVGREGRIGCQPRVSGWWSGLTGAAVTKEFERTFPGGLSFTSVTVALCGRALARDAWIDGPESGQLPAVVTRAYGLGDCPMRSMERLHGRRCSLPGCTTRVVVGHPTEASEIHPL